jgi:predicted PurR-regulated permease PerM
MAAAELCLINNLFEHNSFASLGGVRESTSPNHLSSVSNSVYLLFTFIVLLLKFLWHDDLFRRYSRHVVLNSFRQSFDREKRREWGYKTN